MTDIPIARPARALFAAAAKFDPKGSSFYRRTIVWQTIGIGVAGSLYFWNGLYAAGIWAGAPRLAGCVPAVIDGFIIVSSLIAIYKRSVGDSTFAAWSAVGIYTFISVAANALHPLIGEAAEFAHLRVIVGAGVAALMPFSILMATHLASSIIVDKPEKVREEVRAEIVDMRATAQAEEGRIAEQAAAQEHRAQAQARRQRQELTRQTEWEQLRESPEARKANTHERDKFVKIVLQVFEGKGRGNAARTATLLEISEARVRQLTASFELIGEGK